MEEVLLSKLKGNNHYLIIRSSDRTSGTATDFDINFSNTVNQAAAFKLKYFYSPVTASLPSPFPPVWLCVSLSKTDDSTCSTLSLNPLRSSFVILPKIDSSQPYFATEHTSTLFTTTTSLNSINGLHVTLTQSDFNVTFIGNEWFMVLEVCY